MPYSEKLIAQVGSAPVSLGSSLGKWAIRHDLSIKRLSALTGASRQTIYNWFTNTTEVTPAYTERVQRVLQILKKTPVSQDVWRALCSEFNLKL
jgi:AraC-like DNA-binding protein